MRRSDIMNRILCLAGPIAALAAALAVGACTAANPQLGNLNAVLWQQNSAARPAIARGTYRAAANALDEILAGKASTGGRPAVVLDVDETVLDNSPYQAQNVLDAVGYDDASWDQWLARRAAEAVPGAVEFIRHATASGVEVYYITNRRCLERPGTTHVCPQEEDTLINLLAVGVRTTPRYLMLRGEVPEDRRCAAAVSAGDVASATWSSRDKSERRACVALDHAIVMLLGDHLGDFAGGLEDATLEESLQFVADNADRWGRTWFVLPNPTYGDWLDITGADPAAYLRGFER